MVNNDHINHYSASDILRYLHGKMLPAEMHALERAALDDPFLADAIEGMQQSVEKFDASLINNDLNDLEKRVKERAAQTNRAVAPVIAFRWWQVAAAAAVIVVGGIWAWNSMFTQEAAKSTHTVIVAQQQEVAASVLADSIVAPQGNITVPDSVVAWSATDGKKPAKVSTPKDIQGSFKELSYSQKNDASEYSVKNVTVDNLTTQPVPELLKAEKDIALQRTSPLTLSDSIKENTLTYKELLAKSARQKGMAGDITSNRNRTTFEQVVIPRMQRDSQAAGFYTKPRDAEMNISRRELSAKQLKKNPNALLSGFISGRVTDQHNNPISNALVRVDDNNDFFTDSRGHFNIPAKDSVVNAVVGYTGFYTQNVQLQKNNRVNFIALNQVGDKAPNPALNLGLDSANSLIAGVRILKNNNALKNDDVLKEEAVFNNEDSFKKRKAGAAAITPIIQDAEPECGWLQYQQYLDKNKQVVPDTTGNVVVSFEVNKKGIMTDFKVVQSFGGTVFDNEAIRLIKAGPRWKVNKGHKAKATVIVRF